MRISRNYKCSGVNTNSADTLYRCSRNIKQIKLNKRVADSSFGAIYSGTGIYNNKEIPIIIKIIHGHYTDKTRASALNELFDEVDYGYMMGELGIGPIVYDAFYIDNPDDTYYPNENNIIQYIIMEYGNDLYDLLNDNAFPTFIKIKAINKMIEIIYYLVFELKMYCFDITRIVE